MITFMLQNPDLMWLLLKDHLSMTAAAMLPAVLVGVLIGIITSATTTRWPFLSTAITALAELGQTIPSLVLLGLFIPILGVGTPVAMAALIVRALLPIVTNTHAGIQGTTGPVTEAARGLGMRPDQVLLMVQLPLALPRIVAGIRTATVHCIGIATLAALIGAGGLGALILQGVEAGQVHILFAGAIPAALLALVLDWLLGRVQGVLARAVE